jgi:hypothetical protein
LALWQQIRSTDAIIAWAGQQEEYDMKKAIALIAMAMAVAPVAMAPVATVAPVAHADVCAGAHGRHVAAGGCTDIAGDVATGAAIASATDPYWAGEPPCYTVEGVPYYTPDGDPC